MVEQHLKNELYRETFHDRTSVIIRKFTLAVGLINVNSMGILSVGLPVCQHHGHCGGEKTSMQRIEKDLQ